MANEFIARKGLIALADSQITGSLNISQNIVAAGTVQATFASSTGTDISGAFDAASSSLSSRITSQENFSSSLDNTFATDADLNLVSSSVDSLNAATSSYLQNTTDTLDGDLTVTGTLTAQDLLVQEVTSSIVFSSGSNKFGSLTSDTQSFTGSLQVSGSTNYLLGSVGIGDTNPSFILDTNITSTRARFKANTGDANIELSSIAGRDWLISSLTDGSLRFYDEDAASGRMLIDSGGSIAIGGFSTSGTPAADYRSIEIGRQGNTITGSPFKSALYLSNNATITAGSTAFTYRYASESANRLDLEDGNFIFSNAGSGTVGATISWNERMRIDSSGNVGIGSISPTAKLDVLSTDADWTGRLKNYTAAGYGLSIDLSGGSGDNFALATYTNTGTGFFVRAEGNVGIGTASPRAKGLEIYRAAGQSSYPQLLISTGESSSKNYSISTDVVGPGDLAIIDGETVVAANARLLINSAGNVGIGTSSPSAKLHLYVNSANDDTFHIFNGSVRTHLLASESSNGVIYMRSSANSNTVRINASGFSYFNGGNVGIGTTSPIYKFHVNSSTQAARFTAGDGGYAAVTFDGDAGNTIGCLTTHNGIIYIGGINSGGTGANGEIRIEPSAGNKLSITSDGNIGINTTSPSVKFEVREGDSLLGGTQNNYGGNVYTTTLGGYGVLSTGTDRYGSYGWLTFNANNNYTGAARKFAFTNGYQTNKFALLIGGSGPTDPTLGSQGEISVGQLIFHVNNSADFMFGKVAGDGNGPHLQVNSYSYTSTFQGTSTSDMITIKTGTELNSNVGAIVFRDNGSDYCGQITVNGSTNTVQYLSASDYRLKEDFKDFNGIDLVDKINVYDFKWKKTDVRSYGVVAHELKEVLPLVVDGNKDEDKYQTVDYGKIVPILIKSIQELKAEIDALKNA